MPVALNSARPKSTLEKLYKATQVAEKVHRFNYAVEARIVQKAADALRESPTTSFQRLKLSAKLGLLGGAIGGLGLSGHPNIDINLGALYIRKALPKIWHKIALGPLGTWSTQVLALVVSVYVGSGTPNALSGHSSSKAYRIFGDILQYGVLGLPQAALIKKWDADSQAGKHGSANACLLAATLIAIPLECARVALALAVIGTAVPFTVIFSVFSLAAHTGCWMYDRNAHPRDYAFFMGKPRTLNAGRDYYARPYTSTGTSFEAKSAGPHAMLQKTKETLAFFTEVFDAKTQKDIRLALLEMKQDRLLVTEMLDTLRRYFDTLGKSLSRGDSYVTGEAAELFADNTKTEPTPSWVVSRYRHIVRFLHPDRLSAPGQALPPDTEAMALACFKMLTSLRDLHAAQAAAA